MYTCQGQRTNFWSHISPSIFYVACRDQTQATRLVQQVPLPSALSHYLSSLFVRERLALRGSEGGSGQVGVNK